MSDRQRLGKRIIVSMTSYPARIRYVSTAMESLLNQTMKPDLIILWLAEEQFPKKEEQLPPGLIKLISDEKIVLRWCDDLKPHKKYFYAFREFPHDLIITADDDLAYPPDTVEKLYASYQKHPDCVSTLRAHLIVYDGQNGIAPYGTWIREYNGAVGIPSMQLFCTGVAGILYPAELYDQKLLDRKAITDHCLYSSDVWLKLMEIACGIPAVLADGHTQLKFIDDSQKVGLCFRSSLEKDKQLQDGVHWFEERYGQGFVLTRLLDLPDEQKLLTNEMLCESYRKRIGKLVQINQTIRGSGSYKIGRAITWPYRKVRAWSAPGRKRRN